MWHGHFSVGDWISKRLPSVRAHFVYRFIVELASLVFIAIFFKYSLDLTLHTDEATPLSPCRRSGSTPACPFPAASC